MNDEPASVPVGRLTRLPLSASRLRSALEDPQRTTAGSLYEALPGHGLRCLACTHGCVIADGNAGACGVRKNDAGVMRVPF
ncbi:MAG TPA: hypothetical protein VEX18_02795 [Polyangiaceae bacterium]|nr:hypothetical protein [Polyangiaceae bacterium]